MCYILAIVFCVHMSYVLTLLLECLARAKNSFDTQSKDHCFTDTPLHPLLEHIFELFSKT